MQAAVRKDGCEIAQDRQDTETMTEFRRRMNGMVPIAQLPSEILVEIFAICSYIPLDFTISYSAIRHLHRWLHITHVCHYWRRLALNTPLLWTNILLRKQERAEEMLKRSGNAPLVIRGISGGSGSMDIIAVCLAEISRVCKLELRIPTTRLRRLAQASYPQAVILKSLLLEISSWDEYPDTSTESIGSFISGLRPNQLQQLTVSGIALDPYQIPAFPCLTHLFWDSNSTALLEVSSFLIFLRKLPSLQKLGLRDVLRPSASADNENGSSSPCIQDLDFRGSFTTCRELMRGLRFAANSTFDIHIKHNGYLDLTNSGPMCPFLFRLCAVVKFEDLLTAEIKFLGKHDDSLEFVGWNVILPHRDDLELPPLPPTAKIHLVITGIWLRSPQVLNLLGNLLPLTNIDHLLVGTRMPGHYQAKFVDWKGICRQMRNVTKLCVRGRAMDDLPGRLQVGSGTAFRADHGSDVHETQEHHIDLFPRLQYLRLEEPLDVREREYHRALRFTKELRVALESRNAIGRALQHLDIRKATNICGGAVDELKVSVKMLSI